MCKMMCAAVLLMAAMHAAASGSPTANIPQRLDATIDRALADGRVVGAVVLVLRDGKLEYHRAAGFLDRERRLPMPENAIFRLASSSKAIVSQ